ncbi:MAG: hypothetical protein IH946_09330, partial [Bacteroidetes bacterium]|nr:hypothetical protein [Bacteroidota bacterium]
CDSSQDLSDNQNFDEQNEILESEEQTPDPLIKLALASAIEMAFQIDTKAFTVLRSKELDKIYTGKALNDRIEFLTDLQNQRIFLVKRLIKFDFGKSTVDINGINAKIEY